MWLFLKQLLKQNYSVIVLVLGAFFVGISCITVGQKDSYLFTHAPAPLALFIVGVGLILVSVGAFTYSILHPPSVGGIDLSSVKESRGTFSTKVFDCTIRVVKGKLEDSVPSSGGAVVLPCNEYFDDECASDARSALGAYVKSKLNSRYAEFSSLVREQCPKVFGEGSEQEKAAGVRAISYGVGACLLLDRPLGSSVPLALISTTTQRAQEGLGGSVSYLFQGIKSLFKKMADSRINEVVLPLLGSGHGGVDRPSAFIGLLLAIAEASRRGDGGHRERKITIVIFKKDKNSLAEIDDILIRRGLALIGSNNISSQNGAIAR